MKKFLLFLAVIRSAVTASPIQAGQLRPTAVTCWFLRGEKVELRETCVAEGASWAGGGGRTMRWPDGVVTHFKFGLQGRGERVCPEGSTSVDGVCGSKNYARHPTTLQGMTERERDRRVMNNHKVVNCVQLHQKSICWQW